MAENRQRGQDDDDLTLPQEDELVEHWQRHRQTVLPEAPPSKPSVWERVVIGEESDGPPVPGGADSQQPDSKAEQDPGETGMDADRAGGDGGAVVDRDSQAGELAAGAVEDEAAGLEASVEEAVAAPEGARKTRRGQWRRRRWFGKDDIFSEDEWSKERGSPPWLWLLGGAVCVGFVVGLIWLRRPPSLQVRDSGQPEPVSYHVPIESIAVVGFLQRSDEFRKQASDLIRRFEAGEDLAEILRGGAASAERLKGWRERVPAPVPVHFERDLDLNAIAIDDFGFAVLTGTRRDYSKFGMYFVKSASGLRLDWEASEGFSEVLPGEVRGLADREPRMMRALVRRADFYTDLYPEGRFHCYTLQHLDPTVYVWAFAERESEAAARLEQRLRRRDLWQDERRVVVTIRRGREGSRPNEVEVVKVVGEEWMIPPREFWRPPTGGNRPTAGGETGE